MTASEHERQTELLYGRQIVCELLRAGRRKVTLIRLARGAAPAPELDEVRAFAEKRRIPVRLAHRQHLDQLSGAAHHQGVVAEAGPYPYVPFPVILDRQRRAVKAGFVLVCDHVQDPQNLGALLRTAECAGVDAVVIPRDRAAAVTPAVVRASAGASEHLAVAQVVNLRRALEELRDAGLAAAGLESAPDALLYSEADLTGPLVLVVGSEHKGLARVVREQCDFLLRLPMHGKLGSLNASVAGGVAMYEVARQRLSAGPGAAGAVEAASRSDEGA